MTSCLSLKTALVPARQVCFAFLCSWVVTSLFVCWLGRLSRCCAALVSQVCHVGAPVQLWYPKYVMTWRNREQKFLQGTPKRTVWTSEEGHNPSFPLSEMADWCCAAVCQASVHPWSSCWTRLSTLWVWLPTSSRAQAMVGSLHSIFRPASGSGCVRTSAPSFLGDPVSHGSCSSTAKNSTALLAGCYCHDLSAVILKEGKTEILLLFSPIKQSLTAVKMCFRYPL